MRILEVSYPSRSVTMYIKAHARKVVSYGQQAKVFLSVYDEIIVV